MVNYQDFLKSAERLLQTGDEMGYRNAISRAYYALYHRCLPLYAQLHEHPVDDHHAQVVRALNTQPQYKLTSRRLNSLRKQRNIADYELHRKISRYDAESAVKITIHAIQELDKSTQP